MGGRKDIVSTSSAYRIQTRATYEHVGTADELEALDVLGVGLDVELEERRGITAGRSDLRGRLLEDEKGVAVEIWLEQGWDKKQTQY